MSSLESVRRVMEMAAVEAFQGAQYFEINVESNRKLYARLSRLNFQDLMVVEISPYTGAIYSITLNDSGTVTKFAGNIGDPEINLENPDMTDQYTFTVLINHMMETQADHQTAVREYVR